MAGAALAVTAVLARGFVTAVEESARTRVLRRMRMYGVAFKSAVAADGNCQFRALADQLYDDQERHHEVRKEVTDWLRTHPSQPIDESTKLEDFMDRGAFPTWESYCKYMARDGVWGDHFSLLSAAELYKVNVWVLSSVAGDDKQAVTLIKPTSAEATRMLMLLNWHNRHFDSLKLLQKKPVI